MHRNRVALAVVVVAGFIATGCGSDDGNPEPNSDSPPKAGQGENAKPPPSKSARGQMVECIESELGFEVKPDGDPDKLSVKDPNDKLKAVVVIHPDAGAARKAVAQTLNKGVNAVVFGRAEFIRHAASDTEAGVIANCVAIEYNRPG
jgi:hypothetical protein